MHPFGSFKEKANSGSFGLLYTRGPARGETSAHREPEHPRRGAARQFSATLDKLRRCPAGGKT